MKLDPAAVLKALFAISKEQVARDLAAALADQERFFAHRRAVMTAALRSASSAEEQALRFHDDMVAAHVYGHQTDAPLEKKVFGISHATRQIAEWASEAALNKGRLAELGEQLRGIERREGLAADESFAPTEGPDDHAACDAEADALLESVEDTVFLELLRHYQMEEMAERFERDRATHDVLCEVGRQMVFGASKPDHSALMERILLDRHGQGAVDSLRRRLRDAGL